MSMSKNSFIGVVIWWIALFGLLQETISLKDVNILIPKTVNSGTNVTLQCHFDLGQDQLYSVKWYFNDLEFFRFAPRKQDPINKTFFRIPHFQVDIDKSGQNQVVLVDVRPSQSGAYECEISTGAPNFYRVTKIANLTVTDPASPKAPQIVAPKTIESGENMTVYCNYDLKQEPLFMVKWHFEHMEFYRYDPHGKPQQKFFPLPHFHVELPESDSHKVMLTNVSPEQSGKYMCEVTYDAPRFETFLSNTNVTVTEPASQKTLQIVVPKIINSGENMTVYCIYDSKQAPIYTIKWYFNHREFYRYVPKQNPQQMFFPLPHFHVDLRQSDSNKVMLTDVRPEQSGDYMCEVSTDAPYFHTFLSNTTVTVTDPSEGALKDDKINAFCSVYTSHSRSDVKVNWYLNGEKVDHTIFKMFDTKNGLPLITYFETVINGSSCNQSGLLTVKWEASVPVKGDCSQKNN